LALPLTRLRPRLSQVLQYGLTADQEWCGCEGKNNLRNGRGRGERCSVHRGHQRDEAIPPPRHRGNEAGRLCRIAQHLAQRTNDDAQHRICDRRLGPEGVQEFVFGDQAVRVGHEVVQHGKRFGRQDNRLGLAPEAGVVRVQSKAVEHPLGGRHSSAPRLLTLRAMKGHIPKLYNIFTLYLRSLYEAFMTAVAMPRILAAVDESRSVRRVSPSGMPLPHFA
jgi:hypothetical protein